MEMQLRRGGRCLRADVAGRRAEVGAGGRAQAMQTLQAGNSIACPAATLNGPPHVRWHRCDGCALRDGDRGRETLGWRQLLANPVKRSV